MIYISSSSLNWNKLQNLILTFPYLKLLHVLNDIFLSPYLGYSLPCYRNSFVRREWFGWSSRGDWAPHKCHSCCPWSWVGPWEHVLFSLQGLCNVLSFWVIKRLSLKIPWFTYFIIATVYTELKGSRWLCVCFPIQDLHFMIS